MNTIQLYFRVNPKDMAFVKFIVESYEGLAVLRTLDPREGIMEWMISPDLVEQAQELIDALRKEISILIISPSDKALREMVNRLGLSGTTDI